MIAKKQADPNAPRSVDSQYMNLSQSSAISPSYTAANPMAADPFAEVFDAIVNCRDIIDTGEAIDLVLDLKRQLALLKGADQAGLEQVATAIKQNMASLDQMNQTIGQAAREVLPKQTAGMAPEIQKMVTETIGNTPSA